MAASGAIAQNADSGSLEGKLTDLYSKPLDGVTVVLRNARTGAAFEAVTGRNGAYRVAGLAPGAYALEARSARLGQGRVDGIIVLAGHASRVQTAIALHGEMETATVVRTAPVAAPAQSHAQRRDAPSVAAVARVAVPAQVSLPRAAAGPGTASGAPGKAGSPPAPQTTQNLPATREGAAPPIAQIAEVRVTSASSAKTASAGIPAAETGVEPSARTTVAAGSPTALSAPADLVVAARSATALLQPGAILGAVAAASLNAALEMAALQAKLDESRRSAENALTASLTSEEMEALPVNGRRWEETRLDELPETPIGGEDAEAESRGNWLNGHSAATVDGASTRLAFGGRGVGRPGSASLLGPGGSETAILEMRIVERNGEMAADLPAGEPGGVRTRGGGDANGGRLHGQVFIFDRHNLLGAQNPFTQWVKETAPSTPGAVPVFTPFAWSPGDQRITFGGGAGSAIRSDRLFWFAALDGDRRNNPAVATVKHPDSFFSQSSDDEMQVLSARLRLSPADPVTEGLAVYSSMLETLGELLGPAARTSTRWTGFGRLDWNASARHRFRLEGTWARWDTEGGGLTRASEPYGNHSFGASRSRETWLLGRWETSVTSKLLAVTQVSMGQQTLSRPAGTPSPFEQTLNVNPWGQLPQMVVDSRYGFTIGNPAWFGAGSYPEEHLYQGTEILDWTHGSMVVRAGLDLRHNADTTSFVRNHTGTYHYARVENFASDALVFAQFGLSDALDPKAPHNCDAREKAWRDTEGQLHGLGYLPCYSYYTQTMGPTEWRLETNDWAGFTVAQWRPRRTLTMSAGLRWEREQTPPPIALVDNPDLPLTQRMPDLGNEWAPRVGLAWGTHESRWPVLRLGYGLYYGRTSNRTLEAALTQTGSLKGDVNLLLRPTDNLASGTGGAPPFPYVLGGNPGGVVKPGAVELAPNLEEEAPGHVMVSVSALASLGRRLPVTMDTNFDPGVNPGTITYDVVDASGKGPIKTPQITAPFFASWPASETDGRLNPNYQQILEMSSRANSTYEAGMVRVARTGRRGLSLHARYTYAHTMDWNPDEALAGRGSVLDPLDFRQEYGASDLDVRHSVSVYAIWYAPWRLTGLGGRFANEWMLAGMGQFHSGLPFTMRTAGSLAREFLDGGGLVVGLGPGMNGYGGDNRVYGVGRNTYRYPATWKADMRVGKRFALGHARELDLMAESFNLFNHRNVTEIETVGYYLDPGTTAGSMPKLNFLTGLKTGQTEFGQPLNVNATDFYRERQFDFGIRLRFKHDLED